MNLAFHQSTFDLLGIQPCVSEQRVAAIALRERLCVREFPRSILEWFSVEGVEALFYENTNQDVLTDYTKLGEPSEVSQGYLCVATENQAVVAWYTKLDGTDDPPVFDNNDEWNDDLTTINWRMCSKTFTNFIFDMISSARFGGWYSGAHVVANDKFPDASVIDELRKTYQEGPSSDYADSRVRRFFNTHGVITIASNTEELLSANLAEWSIETDSLDTLYDFASSIGEFYDLRKRLKAASCSLESRIKGDAVLRRVRRK